MGSVFGLRSLSWVRSQDQSPKTQDLTGVQAFYGVNDAVEDFQVVVEAGEFEDLAVGGVGGGDAEVAALFTKLVLHVKNGGQSAAVEHFGAVHVQHDTLSLQARDEGLEVVGLFAAEFVRRMNDDDIAKNFSGEGHGWVLGFWPWVWVFGLGTSM